MLRRREAETLRPAGTAHTAGTAPCIIITPELNSFSSVNSLPRSLKVPRASVHLFVFVCCEFACVFVCLLCSCVCVLYVIKCIVGFPSNQSRRNKNKQTVLLTISVVCVDS